MIRLRPSGVDEVLIKRVQDWYEPGPGVFIQSLTASFSPAMLFTGSTTGAWYDPSDYTTLFQDAAGTQPVTAVEQPVGLMLDKSKGLVLGSELVTNGDFSNGTTGWTAYNSASIAVASGELVVTNTVASYGFAYQAFTTVIGKTYVASCVARKITGDGANLHVATGITTGLVASVSTVNTSATPISLVFTATTTTTYVRCILTNVSGYSAAFDNISVRELPGNHAFNSSGNSANFPVLSARYNLLTKTEQFDDAVWVFYSGTGSKTADTVTFNSADMEVRQTVSLPSGNYSGQFEVKGTPGETIYVGMAPSAGVLVTLTSAWQTIPLSVTGAIPTHVWVGTWSGATARTVQVRKADLRVANDALNQPAYQRVNTATDYDTVGFKPYLRFNGTNQWLQTNSIDFTYGDKMFVCAGVRKLSDAASGVIIESSTNPTANSGTFGLFAPNNTGAAGNFAFFSRGTSNGVADGAISLSPITKQLSGIGNISGDQAILRVNGAQAASGTADQGTGNYGTYPLYIGARAGTSVWFNGRLYGMVVAGKQASAAEITSTETYINQKTGAF